MGAGEINKSFQRIDAEMRARYQNIGDVADEDDRHQRLFRHPVLGAGQQMPDRAGDIAQQ